MFTYTTRVAMHETDAAGIVYFADFFHYAEEAEVHALASVGFKVMDADYLLPRVHVACDYHAPLHFFEQVRAEACLTRIGNSSLHWEIRISGPQGLCATVTLITSRRRKDGSAAPYTAEEKAKLTPLLQTEV